MTWTKVTKKTIKEFQRKQLYIYSQHLLEEKGIDNKLKQEMLYSIFEVWSRKDLTLDQLDTFVTILEKHKSSS